MTLYFSKNLFTHVMNKKEIFLTFILIFIKKLFDFDTLLSLYVSFKHINIKIIQLYLKYTFY